MFCYGSAGSSQMSLMSKNPNGASPDAKQSAFSLPTSDRKCLRDSNDLKGEWHCGINTAYILYVNERFCDVEHGKS